MYLVDSNVYVQALRDPAFGAVLARWEQGAAARLWLSVVVAFEVLQGATSSRAASDYERRLLEPFRRRGRLLATDARVWRTAAAIMRDLASARRYAAKLTMRAFVCDVLIAASCRAVGATLVTANAADFEIIAEVVGFRYVTSFPET